MEAKRLEELRVQRTRVRNLISMIYSQRVAGGPERAEEYAELQANLRKIQAEIEAD